MTFRQVLGEVGVREWIGDPDVEIGNLAHDSRRVGPGTLYFCVSGAANDGHNFAAGAIHAGAVGLVVERPLDITEGTTQAVVESTRVAMGPAAATFYGDATDGELDVIGVTGTNGKTTVAYLVRHLLETAGVSCGLLGTVGRIIGGEAGDAQRTTAEGLELQADFRRMVAAGDRACAMEVSSHALSMCRVSGTHFASAIFTNLTPEHLDFHHDMEEYFAAKRLLFAHRTDNGSNDGGAPVASVGARIVNLDDPYGARLADELVSLGMKTITVSANGLPEADYRAVDIESGPAGNNFNLIVSGSEPQAVSLPLPGRFNVANALCALAAVEAIGTRLDVASALAVAPPVPGRMQPVDGASGFQVVVDYAHTPDSMENALTAARELTEGRLIIVFGAGGDRDRSKRPLMGSAAARLADIAVVTSDNPRSENPDAIIAEILTGMGGTGAAKEVVEPDRRAAIGAALAEARPGDLVLIAGKGHEQGQEFENGRKVPFDDVEVAASFLAEGVAQ